MDLALILGHPAWTVVTGFLMVVATGLLVAATWQLAKAAKGQTAFFERQEKREVKMSHAISTGGDWDKRFGGFTLTNVGVPAVTVMGACISKGIPVAEPNTVSIHIALGWTTEYRERQISSFDPPHRLLTGDRIEVLYDLDALATNLDPGQRIRYECWDTFGNTYVSDWFDYYEGSNSISCHTSPGEGFREPTPPQNPVKL